MSSKNLDRTDVSNNEWISLEGKLYRIGDKVIVLDWENQAGLIFTDSTESIMFNSTGNQVKIRCGTTADEVIYPSGIQASTSKRLSTNEPDRSTACIVAGRICCDSLKIIDGCFGIAGCDFGDDNRCP